MPRPTVLENGVQQQAGRIYAIYGSRRTFTLPAPGSVITLVNRSITGSGDFLVDKGTGRPEVFQNMDINGDGKIDFVLQVGQSDQWFRFTTLGDGQAGNQIRLTPGSEDLRILRLIGSAGSLLPNGGFVVTPPSSFQIGGPQNIAGIMEFDLVSLLDYIERTGSLESRTRTGLSEISLAESEWVYPRRWQHSLFHRI